MSSMRLIPCDEFRKTSPPNTNIVCVKLFQNRFFPEFEFVPESNKASKFLEQANIFLKSCFVVLHISKMYPSFMM